MIQKRRVWYLVEFPVQFEAACQSSLRMQFCRTLRIFLLYYTANCTRSHSVSYASGLSFWHVCATSHFSISGCCSLAPISYNHQLSPWSFEIQRGYPSLLIFLARFLLEADRWQIICCSFRFLIVLWFIWTCRWWLRLYWLSSYSNLETARSSPLPTRLCILAGSCPSWSLSYVIWFWCLKSDCFHPLSSWSLHIEGSHRFEWGFCLFQRRDRHFQFLFIWQSFPVLTTIFYFDSKSNSLYLWGALFLSKSSFSILSQHLLLTSSIFHFLIQFLISSFPDHQFWLPSLVFHFDRNVYIRPSLSLFCHVLLSPELESSISYQQLFYIVLILHFWYWLLHHILSFWILRYSVPWFWSGLGVCFLQIFAWFCLRIPVVFWPTFADSIGLFAISTDSADWFPSENARPDLSDAAYFAAHFEFVSDIAKFDSLGFESLVSFHCFPAVICWWARLFVFPDLSVYSGYRPSTAMFSYQLELYPNRLIQIYTPVIQFMI